MINYPNLNAVNFFCEWCNVRSRNQNDLNEHIAGEKHQSKAYTKKKNLPVQNGPQDGAAATATASSSKKKHKDKASKKLPQKCALCNKMISRKKSLKSHVEKVHESKKPGNAGVFNPNNHNKNQNERRRSLRSHTEKVHERKKPDNEVMNTTPIENSDEENVDNANNPMLEPLIAQIRDLFPELGEGFLVQCLAYFDSNTERVINALLEDNLPPHLANLDRALAKPSQPPANVDQDQGSLLKGVDNKTVTT